MEPFSTNQCSSLKQVKMPGPINIYKLQIYKYVYDIKYNDFFFI